jgi:hypothetical protein
LQPSGDFPYKIATCREIGAWSDTGIAAIDATQAKEPDTEDLVLWRQEWKLGGELSFRVRYWAWRSL